MVSGKISHAYLFSGPRGTGKTSVAKIFAKAINCLNPHNGEPCNECEICVAANEGRLNDVIEIDAASNNGVEEIRDIRDKAKYAPTLAKYKVYIIDEVHMLSKGAFNALLKTLEEPPKNVIFILATTEPHKIPATIISRTQRFAFKRIKESDIVHHLEDILNRENRTYDPEALRWIAKVAEGGMRDALSILDQVIAYSDDMVTVHDVMEVTGSLTYDMMDRYLTACANHQVTDAMTALTEILDAGKESQRFIEDLLDYVRDLLIYKQSPEWIAQERSVLTDCFKNLSEILSESQLYEMIRELSETQKEIKLSVHADIYLEILTVKLSTQKVDSNEIVTSPVLQEHDETQSLKVDTLIKDIQQLQTQMMSLQTQIKNLEQQKMIVSQSKEVSSSEGTHFKANENRIYDIMTHSQKQEAQKVNDVWQELVSQLTLPQQGLLNSSQPKAVSSDGIVLVFSYPILAQKANQDKTLKTTLITMLSNLLNRHMDVEFIDNEHWEKLVQRYVAHKKGNSAKPKENPSVTDAKSIFGEENIIVVDD